MESSFQQRSNVSCTTSNPWDSSPHLLWLAVKRQLSMVVCPASRFDAGEWYDEAPMLTVLPLFFRVLLHIGDCFKDRIFVVKKNLPLMG